MLTRQSVNRIAALCVLNGAEHERAARRNSCLRENAAIAHNDNRKLLHEVGYSSELYDIRVHSMIRDGTA